MKPLEESASQSIFKNGYWFYFDLDGVKITAFGSAWTGKEVIFAGEEIVSLKRSFRKLSEHIIQVDTDQYRIQFVTINIWTGELSCQLFKNDVHLQTLTKAFLSAGWTKKHVGILFITGFILGYFLPKLIFGW